jgi:MarR family transcriptional repressor of emrRAB
MPMTQVPLLLERLAALIHQSVRDDAARHGLLPIHLLILAYLNRANRYSALPIAIAEYFGITRGTVSQSLAILESRGLVRKARDGRDGRRVHLSLTDASQALLAQTWASRLEAAIDTQALDQETLEQALRSLLTGLQRLNGQRAFGVCRGCAHFLDDASGHRCGLTGEPLLEEQTRRICREWRAPSGLAT